MKKRYGNATLLVALGLTFVALLSACNTPPAAVAPAAAQEADQSEAGSEDADAPEASDADMPEESAAAEADTGSQLATATAVTQLTNQPGRAIVSARGNHFIVDSVPPLDGPNEELNPLDMMLGALATCGIFVAEKAAIEQDIPLEGASAVVEGDFDPSGVAGADVNPRLQAFRVFLNLPGADAAAQATLVENFTSRCPVYTTLSESAPIEIVTAGEAESAAQEGLATATVSAQLSNQPGRAIVSARGNHFVIDSVPPLEGPNEERNPLDLMLGALGTCGAFVYERVAQDLEIPLNAITVTVEGDFDPRGVAGEPVNPQIQAFRVHMKLDGPDEEEAGLLQEAFQQRCPIFTTLTRAAPIEITTDL